MHFYLNTPLPVFLLVFIVPLPNVMGYLNAGGQYYASYSQMPPQSSQNFDGLRSGYFYPQQPQKSGQFEQYARPLTPISRVGALQPLNRPSYDGVYWPAAMLNAEGQTTGNQISLNQRQYDENKGNALNGQAGQGQQSTTNLINTLTIALLNAITTALFPNQQRQQQHGVPSSYAHPDSSNLPLINLIPSAGINLGPSQQYGYGSNLGVYAGIQNSASGYNYNYNQQNGQQQQIQPFNRPYGPSNSNVGGSYGGLSQWPFIQPVPNNNNGNGQTTTSTTASNHIASTMARPAQQPNQERSSETLRTTGVIRTLSLEDLINQT